MKVFYGIDRKAFSKHAERVMINARYLISRKIPMTLPDQEWFMDCGAYSLLKEHKAFPFSPKQYMDAVDRHQPTLWANMDWCCEPSILESTKANIQYHIESTILNGRILKDHDKGFVMVIQGWEPEQYLHCIDRIKSEGLITDVMGVGTVCRRNVDKEIIEILRLIKTNLPGHVKLHGFGIKKTILNYKEAFDLLYSIDTFAWNYGCFSIERGSYNDKMVARLIEYQKDMDRLIEKQKNQTKIDFYED